MKRQIVKDLALAAGFKLKKQENGTEDLNEYVYQFAAMLGAHVALSGYADIVKAECLRLTAGDVVAITLKAEFFEHTEFHEFYKKGLTSLMPAGVHCVLMVEGCTLSELPDDELAASGLYRESPSAVISSMAAQIENLKDWRRLALQFDGHRMQAMSMLKMVASGSFDLEEVRQFVAAAPVSGDEHLAQIRAEAIHPIAAERDSLAAQNNRLKTFIGETIKKWRGVPELEPTIWNLQRVLNQQPAACLAHHNFNVITQALNFIGYPCAAHHQNVPEFTKGFNFAGEQLHNYAVKVGQGGA